MYYVEHLKILVKFVLCVHHYQANDNTIENTIKFVLQMLVRLILHLVNFKTPFLYTIGTVWKVHLPVLHFEMVVGSQGGNMSIHWGKGRGCSPSVGTVLAPQLEKQDMDEVCTFSL